jgi:hypothetical protein
MKETIEEIVSELKSRLSSPLFGSYLISWCVINWYVPISLIFYKQNELKLDGYHSYGDMLQRYPDRFHNVLPWFIAIGYTWLYPYIKAEITKHQTEVDTDSQNDITEILGKLKANQDKVVDLERKLEAQRIELIKHTDMLSEAYNKNNDLDNRNQNLTSLRLNDEKQLAVLVAEKESNKRLNQIDVFNGYYKTQTMESEFVEKSEIWEIIDGMIKVDGENKYSLIIHVGFDSMVMIVLQNLSNNLITAYHGRFSENSGFNGAPITGGAINLQKLHR